MTIPVFDELKMLIRVSELPLRYLALKSRVHIKTLRLWMKGVVMMARLDQMVRVALVLRQHIGLTERLNKMVNFYGPRH